MDVTENQSEVARFRQRQESQEQAAYLALNGYAETARHAFIEKRMQLGGERILQLLQEGKQKEAQALMNTENWGVDELVNGGEQAMYGSGEKP